ncbi:MAG TPA: NUDIX domain-containing protein [Caldilineaceae bacterium]|nr:NUDIX domain-containing protein [Caldilineaceae bacterium]
MQATEQGTREANRRRYQVVPRTLIFLTSTNPHSGGREVLLIKGAPTKRLWAGKYNGLGGHVEVDEDILAAAVRELAEETGLTEVMLSLRGVVNIDTGSDSDGARPGVLMFVFSGESNKRSVQSTMEGQPEWIPLANLADYPLVDDLYALIPRVLSSEALFFGHYHPAPDGSLVYHFTP